MVKCECGGTLRPTLIKLYDFSSMAGLPCQLEDVPGLECGQCKGLTLHGKVINLTLNLLAAELVQVEFRLDKDCARFLRKFLGVSQKDLAHKMGIARETVANWERGEDTISPAYDYILRGLVLSHFAERILKRGGKIEEETKWLKRVLGIDVFLRPLAQVREKLPADAASLPAFVIHEMNKKLAGWESELGL